MKGLIFVFWCLVSWSHGLVWIVSHVLIASIAGLRCISRKVQVHLRSAPVLMNFVAYKLVSGYGIEISDSLDNLIRPLSIDLWYFRIYKLLFNSIFIRIASVNLHGHISKSTIVSDTRPIIQILFHYFRHNFWIQYLVFSIFNRLLLNWAASITFGMALRPWAHWLGRHTDGIITNGGLGITVLYGV